MGQGSGPHKGSVSKIRLRAARSLYISSVTSWKQSTSGFSSASSFVRISSMRAAAGLKSSHSPATFIVTKRTTSAACAPPTSPAFSSTAMSSGPSIAFRPAASRYSSPLVLEDVMRWSVAPPHWSEISTKIAATSSAAHSLRPCICAH